MVTIAAIIFTILISIVIVFQIGLVIGMPWGEYAMGGRFTGTYPWKMRLGSMIQIVILFFFAFIVLLRAGIIRSRYDGFSITAIWLVVGFLVLSVVLNFITPSKKERAIWGPISILLLVTSLIVAFQ
ncbi:MAG: hypothetical protein ACOC5R_05530 [Elusimicrobiota bacterium]